MKQIREIPLFGVPTLFKGLNLLLYSGYSEWGNFRFVFLQIRIYANKAMSYLSRFMMKTFTNSIEILNFVALSGVATVF